MEAPSYLENSSIKWTWMLRFKKGYDNCSHTSFFNKKLLSTSEHGINWQVLWTCPLATLSWHSYVFKCLVLRVGKIKFLRLQRFIDQSVESNINNHTVKYQNHPDTVWNSLFWRLLILVSSYMVWSHEVATRELRKLLRTTQDEETRRRHCASQQL